MYRHKKDDYDLHCATTGIPQGLLEAFSFTLIETWNIFHASWRRDKIQLVTYLWQQ